MSSRIWIFLAGALTAILVMKMLTGPVYQGEAELIAIDLDKLDALTIVDQDKLDALIEEARAARG